MIAVAGATIVAGRAGCGFDATWALVWARDALHLNAASIPAHAFSVTPHPGAIALGMVAGVAGFGHGAMTTWSWLVELAVVATFAGVVRLGGLCRSYPAGWIAAVAIAVVPGVRDGIGRGTTDVVCAAACVWAVALIRTRPRLALGLAAFAALCRPEAWLVVVALAAMRWPKLSKRTRVAALGLCVAVPIVWLSMGAAMFGDVLAAVHVTVSNDQGASARGTSFAHTILHLPGSFGIIMIVGLIIGLSVAASSLRHRRDDAIPLVATTALTLGLLAEVADGATFIGRYATPILALALPTALAAILVASRQLRLPHVRPLAIESTVLQAVAAGGLVSLLAVAFWSTRDARLGDNNKFAAQQRAVGSLLAVVDSRPARQCGGVAIPNSALNPVVVAAFPEGSHIDIANGVDVANAVGARPGECALSAASVDALNADGWGPTSIGQFGGPSVGSARVVAENNQWALYER